MMQNIVFITNWTQGSGLSGGDAIWIELAKAWKNLFSLKIVASPEAELIARRCGLSGDNFILSVPKLASGKNLSVINLVRNLLFRTIQGIKYLKKNREKLGAVDYIYSVSDFWPDVLPAYLLKRRCPNARWIAGFYLFAPSPWDGNSPYKGIHWIKGFFYYLIQQPVYWLVRCRADYVFVTSEPDVKKFITKKRDRSKIIVVQGGVDLAAITRYLNGASDAADKKYAACFLGRLHHQKGVLLLIEIWAMVVRYKPGARLAVIGDGELETELRKRIKAAKLERNIDLLGFLDGEEKFRIFRSAHLIVHPATYDSGGMSAAEGMAFGLPGVAFDLDSLRTYYPKGMLKTPCFDLPEFARNIMSLLDDRSRYETIRQEALTAAKTWDWPVRAENVRRQVFERTGAAGAKINS